MSLCAHVTQANPHGYVARANERLAGAPAEEILAWAVAEFGDDLTVACSMQDAVVVHLAATVAPGVEVAFLDTGFHFPETLATARELEERYDINLVTLRPVLGAADRFSTSVEACCAARKVEPLERHLETRSAWVTGVRRAESPTRAGATAVEWDDGRQMIKVNPIVDWTDEDVDRYIAGHDVLVNPLRHQGYASIGCQPCTTPGDGRAGRWAGSDKLECGLHERPRLTLAVTERS